MKRIILIVVAAAWVMAARADDASRWARYSFYAEANDSLVATGARPEVVMMGNSITQFWPERGAMYAGHPEIVCRGISGQTSAQMLLRFYADVVALHPRVVVIGAGTNDIAENAGPYSQTQTMNNIRAMVGIALAEGIVPVLATVPPAERFSWRPEVTDAMARIQALNAQIRQYAAEKGLTCVDYYPLLLNADGTGMDPAMAVDRPAVHPNRRGYALMEAALLAALSGNNL